MSWLLAEKLAVTRLDPDIPNVKLFEFEKTSVPVLTLCVPTERPNGVSDAEAVIVLEPTNPKVILFEFEKTTVPVDTDCPPAETPNGVSGNVEMEAVSTDPFETPKLTELESLHSQLSWDIDMQMIP